MTSSTLPPRKRRSAPVISVIGCGGVGSRHLEALLKLAGPAQIQVAERARHAMKRAQLRAEEAGIRDDITITWHEAIETLSPADLTIVATLATGRADLISRLLDAGDRRFLVEKVAFQSGDEFDRVLEMFSLHDAKGWVNCPRRYYPFYESLRRDLGGGSPVILQVSAGNRGLGCNAIHFVDLFEYLTGRIPFSIDGTHIIASIERNRRDADLVEFNGTLSGATRERDTLEITFAPVPLPTALVSLSSPGISSFADEARGFSMRSFSGSDSSWEAVEFGHRHVSEVTSIVARDILETDGCRLATLPRSAEMHTILFDAFNGHIERITGIRPLLCPIT